MFTNPVLNFGQTEIFLFDMYLKCFNFIFKINFASEILR